MARAEVNKQRPPTPFPSKEMTVGTGSTDRALVARCQAGDMEAFETLYRKLERYALPREGTPAAPGESKAPKPKTRPDEEE